MSGYRNFKLTTYFVAGAAARVTREELEKQLEMKMDRWMYLEDLAARINSGD